jgi:hypothetical protein
MIMSATARVLCDELFHSNVDLVQRLTRSLETSIFLWRRILSGRAGPDGGQLLEDRRQRFVEYFLAACDSATSCRHFSSSFIGALLAK